jgi:hypothetical protein
MAIIKFGESIPHIVQELMCIRCKKRFISVRPRDTWLKDLECPKCRKVGYIIATGQPLEQEE